MTSNVRRSWRFGARRRACVECVEVDGCGGSTQGATIGSKCYRVGRSDLAGAYQRASRYDNFVNTLATTVDSIRIRPTLPKGRGVDNEHLLVNWCGPGTSIERPASGGRGPRTGPRGVAVCRPQRVPSLIANRFFEDLAI